MSKLSLFLLLMLMTVFKTNAQVKQSGDTSFILLPG